MCLSLPAGMLSVEGRCKTLDAAADGYVRAEAVGVMLLQAYAALAAAAAPVAIIHSAAVNQDGRSSSLTAPNGPAQQEVIRAALSAAGLNPGQVTGLSLHGTGTSLGDPIEVGAAAEVFGGEKFSQDDEVSSNAVLTLGASKSWVGHAEPAAGMVGVYHALLGLSQAATLPVLHLKTLNPLVMDTLRAAGSKSGARPWHLPRQAGPGVGITTAAEAAVSSAATGVSAFAFQGTNAHVVLSAVPAMGSEAAASAAAPMSTWKKQQLWPLPLANLLLRRCSIQKHQGAVTALFEAQLGLAGVSYMWDHQVQGRVLFPGAGFMEMGLAAVSTLLLGGGAAASQSVVGLGHVAIPSPMVLPTLAADGELPRLVCQVNLQTQQLQIFSMAGLSETAAAATRRSVHMTAEALAVAACGKESAATVSASSAAQKLLEVYRGWGWNVAGNPTSVAAAKATGTSFASFQAPALEQLSSCFMHPASLDSALQLGALPQAPQAPVQLRVPAAVALVTALTGAGDRRPAQWCTSRSSMVPPANLATATAVAGSAMPLLLDYSLQGATGACCFSVEGLLAKPLNTLPAAAAAAQEAAMQQAEDLLFETEYFIAAPTLEDALLEGVPQRSTRYCVNTDRQADVGSLAAELSLLQYAALEQPAALAAGLGAAASSCPAALSPCGMHAPAAAAAVRSSELHGMLRSAALELPATAFSATTNGAVAGAEYDMVAGGGLGEVRGVRDPYGSYSLGAVQLERNLVTSQHAVSKLGADMQLIPEPRGSLSSLVPAAVDLSPGSLAAGHVGVRVQAVGLNFRDVLNVLGMYPGDPGAPGGDCAGLVVTSSASSLCPGQSVFGLAVGSLGSAVVCAADTLVVMPSSISYEEAASMPTVFITAHKALADVTAVQPGESVLVHAAAGGVGLAASQVLAGLGAVCVATGGSPSKRVLLRGLGVGAVVGSRDSSFVEPLAQLGGCDVLLNSLTSPGMVAASMALIKQGGRMAEIGKRDIWSAAAAAAERPDVNYNCVAVDFLPGWVVQTALQKVAAGVAAGMLHPIPIATHELSSVIAALRQLSQARNVGKVVVRHTPPPLSSGSSTSSAGRVLVTGGLGALGALVAKWLAGLGVTDIQLLSRSGRVQGKGPREICDLLRSSLSSITISQADTSFAEDVAMLFELAGDKTIGALFHAGGVLADATLQQQKLQGVRRVMAAKQRSLALLLPHLQRVPMQSTVLFSSVASLLGSPGQSNYAAANAGLDGAAGVLSAAGLGVVSCQWGAWAGAGMAAQDASTAARVARSGMELLQPQQGLAALEQLLRSSVPRGRVAVPVVSAVPFIWSTFLERQKRQHKGSVPALFAEFAGSISRDLEGAAAAGTNGKKVVASFRGRQQRQVQVSVQDTVSQAVQEVLGTSVSPDEPLMAAGLDSLGAVELRNALEGALGISLPGTLVFDYPSLSAMTAYLGSKLADTEQQATFDDADEMLAGNIVTPAAQQRVVYSTALSRHSEGSTALCIGVVAMSGQLPQSCPLSQMEAVDAVTRVPYSRWDVDWASSAVGEQQVSFGSFLQGVAAFDAAAFNLSEPEALVMDPQQRLLLHHSLEVLAKTPAVQLRVGGNSGAGAALAAYKAGCGVFVGVSSRDYYTIAQKGNQVSGVSLCFCYALSSNLHGIIHCQLYCVLQP